MGYRLGKMDILYQLFNYNTDAKNQAKRFKINPSTISNLKS